MDYKKTNAPSNTVTRDMMDLCADTGNIYETVAIIGKRANQISVEMKNDLSKKLQEFASYNDNLEEVFENREQIEISRYYEKLPKPTLIAAQEYEEGKVYFRNPAKEKRETTVIFHLGLCKRSLPQVTRIVLF
ncbi:DNA-directed RNA polymerase subunit omega [Phocaeicola vulgatus]|nr:DNA-directed RNA polymerase subunit omega [Phocaeicola vulgatus]